MGESEEEPYEEDQEPTEAENLVNRNQELIESLREQKKEKVAQELLQQLPQGEGSGLDADKVDGLHARDILGEIRKVRLPPPLGAGGSGGTGPHAETHVAGETDEIYGNVTKIVPNYVEGLVDSVDLYAGGAIKYSRKIIREDGKVTAVKFYIQGTLKFTLSISYNVDETVKEAVRS